MSSAETTPAASPDYFVVDSPYEIARWRPLVNWILYIPHGIIVYVLRLLSGVVFLIYWLILIFTGKLNPGLYGILAMYERYAARAGGFLFGYTEEYPPFDFNNTPADNNAYPPIRVNLPEAPPETSRVAALNFILAIPHYIWLMIVGIAAGFVFLIAWFAVLFTAKWPEGMRDFVVRYWNYWLRIFAYVAMVDPAYPSFKI